MSSQNKFSRKFLLRSDKFDWLLTNVENFPESISICKSNFLSIEQPMKIFCYSFLNLPLDNQQDKNIQKKIQNFDSSSSNKKNVADIIILFFGWNPITLTLKKTLQTRY